MTRLKLVGGRWIKSALPLQLNKTLRAPITSPHAAFQPQAAPQPGRTQLVVGDTVIKLPGEKPPPPKEDECCMSGCAVCVYDIYQEDLLDYTEKRKVARQKALDYFATHAVDKAKWPIDSLGPYPDNKSEENTQEKADDLPDIADPTLKAFLEMERRLKKSKKSG